MSGDFIPQKDYKLIELKKEQKIYSKMSKRIFK